MEWDGEEPVFVGISKIDLAAQDHSTAVVKNINYGKATVGGEAFFVPSHLNPADCEGRCSIRVHHTLGTALCNWNRSECACI